MKRSVLVTAIICILLPSVPRAEMKVVGTETIAVTSTTATLSSIPSTAHKARISFRGGSVSWFADGQTPTTTNGNVASEAGVIELECQDEMQKFEVVLNSGETGVALAGGLTGVTGYVHYIGNE